MKAVALDMDGTILNDEHIITDELLSLMSSLQEKGYYIFLATGRTLSDVQEVLAKDMKPDGIAAANGMVAVAGEKMLADETLDEEIVRKLIEENRKHRLYYEIHMKDGRRVSFKEDEISLAEELEGPKAETVRKHEWNSRQKVWKEQLQLEEDPDLKEVVKVYFFTNDQEKLENWEVSLGGNKAPFITSSSSEHNVEVMKEGISKGSALELLLDYYSIAPEELIAIGDGGNDIPMLELAGRPVVMSNAPEELKDQFPEVTDYPNTENGVYKFLKEALEEKE
ncbi:Cof-type HAD-IIB family hydrolase [Salimicrobium jeotgali]|uniref:Cof-type HAD-IIB family hydrolase n=1 Tax=Salimicrobium jeotgali TaxID=1230341 RepID=UPI000C819C63|nr:Cof-type HAD-IIB family hydrolase [Salimicrobium jeotgali]